MTHNEMRDWIGGAMKEKGFHEPMGFGEGGMVRCALVQTELAEAMQEVKRFWGKPGLDQEAVKSHVTEECADAAIRLFDMAFVAGVDLAAVPVEFIALPAPKTQSDDERRDLLIQLGAVASVVGKLFDMFEDVKDGSDRDESADWALVEIAEYTRFALNSLQFICDRVCRDLNTAIEAKMVVNMQRPHRYGTPSEGRPVQNTGGSS